LLASPSSRRTNLATFIQTGGSADDSNGSGINGYIWYRSGVQVASTQTPEWSDVAATPGSTQSYGVQAQDHHGNLSAMTTFSVGVPSNATVDARQAGVRPTGSYWGGMGEQIDTRSGNLNYSYPLVKAISRGWSVPIGISYNSQNWRLDTNGTPWKLGDDVGFGFGWKMQIGSLTAFYSSYLNVQFYEFSDASGAVYRLNQNSNGIWTSTENVYVTYDSNTQRLYFNDGSFWVLGCISAVTEQDAGAMYPTLLQDSNGNQVTVQYLAGAGVSWVNSSARILNIQDVRPGNNPAGSPTFFFSYNSDPVNHLTYIGNDIYSNDSFYISYGASTAANSPFGVSSGSFGSTTFLNSINNHNNGLTTSFTYDPSGSGELTQVTLPLQRGWHQRLPDGRQKPAESLYLRRVPANSPNRPRHRLSQIAALIQDRIRAVPAPKPTRLATPNPSQALRRYGQCFTKCCTTSAFPTNR